MKELEKILNLEGRTERKKLSESEKKIIRYLLKLKNPDINITSLAREVDMARVTAAQNYERLHKEGIIRQVWELNPFLMGFKIISAEISIPRAKEQATIAFLKKHPAIRNIFKLYHDRLLVEFIVQEVDDFNAIQQKLKDLGVEFFDSKIAIGKIYES